jgi:hypothetical protein
LLRSHHDGGIHVFKEAGSSTESVWVRGNIAINPGNSVSSYLVGSVDPAKDGFPEQIVIDGNVAHQVGMNSPALRIESAKRLLVTSNLLRNLGITSGSVGVVQIRGSGETAGTANYSDQLEFRNNVLLGTLNGGAAVTAFATSSALDTSSVRMAFVENLINVTNNVFLRSTTIVNPNIVVLEQPDTGLGIYGRGSVQGHSWPLLQAKKPAHVSPVLLTDDQNDFWPSDVPCCSSFLRLRTDGRRTITGLANGTQGRVLFLENSGSHEVVLANDSRRSAAPNRIITSTGGVIALAPNDAVIVFYDTASSRWRLFDLPLRAAR